MARWFEDAAAQYRILFRWSGKTAISLFQSVVCLDLIQVAGKAEYPLTFLKLEVTGMMRRN